LAMYSLVLRKRIGKVAWEMENYCAIELREYASSVATSTPHSRHPMFIVENEYLKLLYYSSFPYLPP
jgi:hypothetical protein